MFETIRSDSIRPATVKNRARGVSRAVACVILDHFRLGGNIKPWERNEELVFRAPAMAKWPLGFGLQAAQVDFATCDVDVNPAVSIHALYESSVTLRC